MECTVLARYLAIILAWPNANAREGIDSPGGSGRGSVVFSSSNFYKLMDFKASVGEKRVYYSTLFLLFWARDNAL